MMDYAGRAAQAGPQGSGRAAMLRRTLRSHRRAGMLPTRVPWHAQCRWMARSREGSVTWLPICTGMTLGGHGEEETDEAPEPQPEAPTIKATSFESSKGLSAQHVFIVGLHKGEIPRGAKATDFEVCKFLVALTNESRGIG